MTSKDKQKVELVRLQSAIVGGRPVILIIPTKMIRKDYEYLRRWIDLLEEAEEFDDSQDAAPGSEDGERE